MANPFYIQYKKAVAIAPNDGTFLTDTGASAQPTVGTANPLYKAFYVGGAGVLALFMLDGTTVNFTVPAGTILPVLAQKVMATNTTATLIVGLA